MNNKIIAGAVIFGVLNISFGMAATETQSKPYRLKGLYDHKAEIVWGSDCRVTDNQGLAFDGEHKKSDDGSPHTRILRDGVWTEIHTELRNANPLQKLHDRTWALRCGVKDARARARFVYFKGLPAAEEATFIKKDIELRLAKALKELDAISSELSKAGADKYQKDQALFAQKYLKTARPLILSLGDSIVAEEIKGLHRAQILIALASEALDAEPPARVLSPLVWDSKAKLYVLFGGDHLDYITNDTWVFDPAKQKWFQRHPVTAPAPRANHKLTATGDGKVTLSSGYRYSSSTAYLSGQYQDVNDGEWVYDIENNSWTGAGTQLPSDTREYRTGALHPDFFLQGEKPSASAWEATLEAMPVNEWILANPPYLPRLNRDWGTVRSDPNRDMILRWSGGHSAHGGTDVLHYHFGVNRWELPIPVEFPLDCLYSNTTYPNGYNLNRRPWMTGHTYNNYAYDPPSKKMIQTGRPSNFYIYDPEIGDWIGRGKKPKGMSYYNCFYTLTVTATPQGALCWGNNRQVHLYDHVTNAWSQLKLTGDKLSAASVDNSTSCYDSKRGRVLVISKPYGHKNKFGGQIHAIDPKTGVVTALSPKNMAAASQISRIDRGCYDAKNDIFLLGSGLRGHEGVSPTAAYDCANNCWVSLDIKYKTKKRGPRTVRLYPAGVSSGIIYDPKRKLIWGTDAHSQVYILRLDAKKAGMTELKGLELKSTE